MPVANCIRFYNSSLFVVTHASTEENVLMMLICTHVTVPVVGMEFSVNTILTSVSGIIFILRIIIIIILVVNDNFLWSLDFYFDSLFVFYI